jgi:phosphoglycolate phosphatase-like HAD superfamily hydrolase
MKPENFKIILWDFDGVIIESNSVREAGFREVLKSFPNDQIEALIDYHNLNGGLSRYVKFRYFYEHIRKETITSKEVDELAFHFSEIMMKLLINPDLLITPVINFLHDQFNTGKIMHIVSGSDQIELRELCKSLSIDSLFHSINGSPTHKSKLVRTIIESNKYDKSNYCLIGDSINDFDAAMDNDITFFGYNNINLMDKVSYFIPSK